MNIKNSTNIRLRRIKRFAHLLHHRLIDQLRANEMAHNKRLRSGKQRGHMEPGLQQHQQPVFGQLNNLSALIGV